MVETESLADLCDRSDIVRTCEEICKTLNSCLDFLTFTTESEEDFTNNYLPTLDVQTKVNSQGVIEFMFFSKPMANNLLIQRGSALPKNIIFSSLRQDLIRRLCNCSEEVEIDERLKIINNFIQLLVNSQHKYPFIKSVVLQALTKHKTMVARAALPQSNKRHMPLYRSRHFNWEQRTLLKCVEPGVWYKDLSLGDRYKNVWKGRVSKKPRMIKEKERLLKTFPGGGRLKCPKRNIP